MIAGSGAAIAAAPVELRQGLTTLDYSLVVLYMVVMLGFGWWFSRRQSSAEDYFVGGRRMPWFVTGVSVFATLLSTISYLAMPGEMIKKGIGILAGQVALPFAFLFVAFLVMPFYKRVDVTSAYEYLEKRFDLSVRWLGALLFMMIRVAWMSLVIYTASMALAAMTGIDIYVTIAVVGLIATVYTALGGIQAVIWTDFVQFIILFGGVIFAIGYVILQTGTGPLKWLSDAATVGHTKVPLFALDPTVRISAVGIMIHVFFWQICTHGSDQVAVQRYLSTPSLKAARRTLGVGLICDIMLALVLSACGIALFSFYMNHPALAERTLGSGAITEHADKVFPKFIATQLPPGVAGVVVAALFAAAMSSLDSGVNSISTVITVDFYRRLRSGGRGPQPQEAPGEIALARWVTLICGMMVTAAACGIVTGGKALGENIVEMTNRINSFVVGPLAGLFFCGMFNRRCSARAAFIATGVGMLWGLILTFSDTLGAMFWRLFFTFSETRLPERVSFTYCIWHPCVMTYLVAHLLSQIWPETRNRELAGFVLGLRRETGRKPEDSSG